MRAGGHGLRFEGVLFLTAFFASDGNSFVVHSGGVFAGGCVLGLREVAYQCPLMLVQSPYWRINTP